jgi:transcriptional regulator with XRE-family HTH domain
MTLVFDKAEIGNRLLQVRKQAGYTQAEVADKSNISERAYADIERGTKNMRIETLCKICETLKITPDYLLVENYEENLSKTQEEMMLRLNDCTPKEKDLLLKIMAVYLDSAKE